MLTDLLLSSTQNIMAQIFSVIGSVLPPALLILGLLTAFKAAARMFQRIGHYEQTSMKL